MNTNKCLLCNSNSNYFLPCGIDSLIIKKKQVIGAGYRENVVCPICKSNDRERLLHLYLLHQTDTLTNNYKLLHIAPEKRLTKILRTLSNLDYITADLYMESVDIKLDLTNTKLPSNTFDCIICNHVLEHIIDDIKALSELYRILKKDSWAILQVPISHILSTTYEDYSIITEQDREIHFGQHDNVRIYAANDYINRLKQVGFTITIFNWIDYLDLFGTEQNIYRLNKEELIYIAYK